MFLTSAGAEEALLLQRFWHLQQHNVGLLAPLTDTVRQIWAAPLTDTVRQIWAAPVFVPELRGGLPWNSSYPLQHAIDLISLLI